MYIELGPWMIKEEISLVFILKFKHLWIVLIQSHETNSNINAVVPEFIQFSIFHDLEWIWDFTHRSFNSLINLSGIEVFEFTHEQMKNDWN